MAFWQTWTADLADLRVLVRIGFLVALPVRAARLPVGRPDFRVACRTVFRARCFSETLGTTLLAVADQLSPLDEAASRGLLFKVGGSYRLSSRLLRSYFASRDEPIPPHITALQNQLTVTSLPAPPVADKPAIITYEGYLMASAQRLTMHWGINNWNNITDTAMTRQRDGTWQATIMIPIAATTLNMAFYDQSDTWDNLYHNDYHLNIPPHPAKRI